MNLSHKEFYRSLQKLEDVQNKIAEKEAEIQKVKDEFNIEEQDIAATEQNVEAEKIDDGDENVETVSDEESEDSNKPAS